MSSSLSSLMYGCSSLNVWCIFCKRSKLNWYSCKLLYAYFPGQLDTSFSERMNRTWTSLSSIKAGNSMRFDGSIELLSSIHRTKIEPNLYPNETFSTYKQENKKCTWKINKNWTSWFWFLCGKLLFQIAILCFASISFYEIADSRFVN